jgi:VWFA-related protein
VGRLGQVGRVGLVGLVGLVSLVGAQTQPQPPPFKSSVEVTSLDVSVVDDRGKPIANLAPGDFTVRIDGAARKVVTAEWVPLATEPSGKEAPAPPEGYSTNESSIGGRLIVLAIDEPNIRFGGALAITKAANAFIDRLSPSDRIAVAGFGLGSPGAVFTADRERVKRAISRMAGQKQTARTLDINVGLAEAQAIEKGDRTTLEMAQARECQGLERSPGALEACRNQVEMEARSIARDARFDAERTVQNLRDLFTGLSRIDAPKTLILISEGFVLTDDSMIFELGTMAAQARTSVYALKLDNELFDVSNARMPVNPFGDRQARAEGLDTLAGVTRGTLFTVTGTGQALFDRIESELSGYYLLGVESEPRDHDGKSHSIRVDTPRRAATVRTRRQVLNARSDRVAPRSPRAAVTSALTSPLLSSALPMRVASFSLQGPERDKVQLLIHADVGTDYASSKGVAVGYIITDKDGRQIDSKSEVTRLTPAVAGVPSSLQYTTGASLAPGDYSVKLAIAEGDRVGTVEHAIHAALPEAGALKLSELMVGGPPEAAELVTPTIGYQVTFGAVQGYLEAYGSKLDDLTMEYEIATDPSAPALINVDVASRQAGDARMIFTRVVPVPQLPPGKYVLRAILSSAGRSIKTLTRAFEVAPPKVLMTSAEGLGVTSVDAELFLPVDDVTMTPVFRREDATSPDTLEVFVEHLDPGTKAAFDDGVVFLSKGDYAKAEVSFKRAIQPEVDSTAALVYLAAAFAASGHDNEAASAWQTALVDGSDLPQIYEWLVGALMRAHQLGEARTILEEAVGKWPTDGRFTKPLAMVYGTFGRGREAVRTLERYLAERPNDRDTYYLAVQWLYTVHGAGAVVHSRAEDLKLAHTYADAYAKAGGPQLALVKQWVQYLDSEARK